METTMKTPRNAGIDPNYFITTIFDRFHFHGSNSMHPNFPPLHPLPPSIHSISTHRVPASCAYPQCVTRLACHASTCRGLLECRATTVTRFPRIGPLEAESRREGREGWNVRVNFKLEPNETVSNER